MCDTAAQQPAIGAQFPSGTDAVAAPRLSSFTQDERGKLVVVLSSLLFSQQEGGGRWAFGLDCTPVFGAVARGRSEAMFRRLSDVAVKKFNCC